MTSETDTRQANAPPNRHDVTYRRATSHEIKPPYLCVCIKYLCDLIPQRLGLTLYVPINSIPPSFSVPSDQIKANKSILSRVESLRRVVALLLTLCPACLFAPQAQPYI